MLLPGTFKSILLQSNIICRFRMTGVKIMNDCEVFVELTKSAVIAY